MASITTLSGSRRMITLGSGEDRKTIRLGKVTMKRAQDIKTRIEYLQSAVAMGLPIDSETSTWLASIDDSLAEKLAKAGLAPRREPKAAVTLDDFLTAHLDGLNIKPGTRFNLDLTRRNLVEFFGADKPLAAISLGDADDWRRWLVKKYSDNTVRRRCGRAKQFFRAAVRKRLIAESPFADMKDCHVNGNKARDYFVTLDEANKVLAACPDAQWKLLFALSRFGGLRCPSEHVGLKWSDIDWDQNRFTVHSPKTEHHDGKESRVVPIFAELRPYLEAAKSEAASGQEYVITIPSLVKFRQGSPSPNVRTQMERIIDRAGLDPWPKLFHNLRATRQTELAQSFPEHVVCEWIGNSQAVAREHYLRVTDGDFAKAAGQGAAERAAVGAQQNAQQPPAANLGQLRKTILKALRENGLEAAIPVISQAMNNCPVDPNGTRTRVTAVKGRCPRPLDDGAEGEREAASAPAAQSDSYVRYNGLDQERSSGVRAGGTCAT